MKFIKPIIVVVLGIVGALAAIGSKNTPDVARTMGKAANAAIEKLEQTIRIADELHLPDIAQAYLDAYLKMNATQLSITEGEIKSVMTPSGSPISFNSASFRGELTELLSEKLRHARAKNIRYNNFIISTAVITDDPQVNLDNYNTGHSAMSPGLGESRVGQWVELSSRDSQSDPNAIGIYSVSQVKIKKAREGIEFLIAYSSRIEIKGRAVCFYPYKLHLYIAKHKMTSLKSLSFLRAIEPVIFLPTCDVRRIIPGTNNVEVLSYTVDGRNLPIFNRNPTTGYVHDFAEHKTLAIK